MVNISPFRGLIYNNDKAGDLSTLISPPYDVISTKLKKKLLTSNSYNIVKLILPEGDGQKKYSAAGNLLNTWINKGILEFDRDKSYYILEIKFKIEENPKKIIGFIGLAGIEPYSKNVILRHEKTLPKPRKDRYSLLKNSRTNFGLIYTIYRDPERLITRILDSYRDKKPTVDIIPYYEQDLSVRLWKITDKKDISAITDTMKDKKILIADGHHRYETSLMYSDNSLKANNKILAPEDFALTLFMESGQEDIGIYPTYRSFRFSDFTDFNIFLEKSSPCFNIDTIEINNASDIRAFLDDLRKKKNRGFIFYTKQNRFFSFTTLESEKILPSCGFSIQELDVNILHGQMVKILEHLYGKSEVIFSDDFDFIIENVKNGNTDLGVFLNPPTIDEMEEVCNSGKLMPQKSTFFWPKPPTGLVMYKFDR